MKHLYQIMLHSNSLKYRHTSISASEPQRVICRRLLENWYHILLQRLIYIILALVVWLGVIDTTPAVAANLTGDLLKQPATEIRVSLGTSTNELKFEPKNMEFLAGKRYNLHLSNPSQLKHYFTAKDFADGIWTQKVEAGKVEIKGAIHELELKPGAEAEWVFVPLKSGKYPLRCSIPGHTEAGMIGDITISYAK